MGDEADAQVRHRADAEIQHLKVQALEVRHVAGDMVGHHLTPAVPGGLVGGGEAAQHGEAPVRPVVLDDDVLMSLVSGHVHRQPRQGLPLGFREVEQGDARNLADERMVVRLHRSRHRAPLS